MEKINIKFLLDNKEMPYLYEGEATLNKDIIEFNDQDTNYIYDKKINRLTKIKDKLKFVLDFDNEVINIEENGIEINIKFKIKKKKIIYKKINIIYSIENNKILFELEVK